jgi:deoxycytidylate deaminase
MAKSKAQVQTLFDARSGLEPIPLADRKTDELVIGMVGAVASGVSFSADIIAKILREEFKYEGEIVKVSKFINENASKIEDVAVSESDRDRVKKLQGIGSKLREKFGANYLAEKCVEHINIKRGSPTDPSQPRRHFTIIDSLKNPEEIDRLYAVYGENFWLFGIFAPEPIRKSRLQALGNDSVYAEQVMRTDQDEGLKHGQLVRDTMQLSDFFIRNAGQNAEPLTKTITRFLDIVFGTSVVTPTLDESSMFAAMSSATGSACLSRQVGAVITSLAGDIIGRGANDVPKYKGGLYNVSDEQNDHRCYKWKQKICHNDDRKSKLLDQSVLALKSEGALKNATNDKALTALKGTGLKNLIEFSRSIHAEMEAIISVARAGKPGLVGSTLYCTTFPCHSCARHIVASGIERVIYIEPYSKSLALDLHDDSISISEDEPGKVKFLQYEGVAPKNAMRLFKDRGDRKIDGKLSLTSRSYAHPATHGALDGLAQREQLIVFGLRQRESQASGIMADA